MSLATRLGMATAEEGQQAREKNVAEIRRRIHESDQTVALFGGREVKCVDANTARGYRWTGSGLVFYAGKVIERIDYQEQQKENSMDERTLYEIGTENDNWREVAPHVKTLMSLICGLPGGDELEDLGIEPINIGWREFDQLGRWIMAIDSADDVKATIKAVLHGVDEENDSEE